jgi:hypothetical protein
MINLKKILISISLLIILGLALPVAAQSGRKLPNHVANDPPPAAPPDEPAPPKPAPKPTAPPIPLLVTIDQLNVNFTQAYSSVVLDGVVSRLRATERFEITAAKEMNRKQASDRAKAEKELYVCWMELDTDSFQPQSINDIHVEYVIYEPATAKIHAQGRVYLRPYQQRVGVGGVGIPLPTGPVGTNPLEYSLRQAGFEAADRILAAFNVPPPLQR